MEMLINFFLGKSISKAIKRYMTIHFWQLTWELLNTLRES